MRIERGSFAAVKYACLNFHYAKRVPVNIVGYSVFNDLGEWCGVVVFGAGIRGIESPYSMAIGSVWELVRVALNGNHGLTSKAVSLAVKMFKKDAPLVQLLVSYADSDESHKGTIYQAMNWTYEGKKKTSDKYVSKSTGKSVHSRQISISGSNMQFGVMKKCYKPNEVVRISAGFKHKYAYPLSKKAKAMIDGMAKPYPKCV